MTEIMEFGGNGGIRSEIFNLVDLVEIFKFGGNSGNFEIGGNCGIWWKF
jgi:hypothetical protein